MFDKQQIGAAVGLILNGDRQTWEQGYFGIVHAEVMREHQGDYPIFDYEYRDRRLLYAHVNEHVLKNRPVDYLEFGVAGGQSFRDWLSLNTCPESRFVGFDSFEGLPEDWHAGNREKGAFSQNGVIPNIKDPRGSFVKGWFNQTLEPFLAGFTPERQLVLHLDADLYSSTLYVLMTLNRVIRRGTVMIFDDFQPRDDFAAFHHWAKACGRNWRILAARRDHYKLAAVVW